MSTCLSIMCYYCQGPGECHVMLSNITPNNQVNSLYLNDPSLCLTFCLRTSFTSAADPPTQICMVNMMQLDFSFAFNLSIVSQVPIFLTLSVVQTVVTLKRRHLRKQGFS